MKTPPPTSSTNHYVSFLPENSDALVESGQMTLLRGDAEVAPGISVRVYPGHTRDMQADLVQSGGKTACYISDLIPTNAHLDLNWVVLTTTCTRSKPSKAASVITQKPVPEK